MLKKKSFLSYIEFSKKNLVHNIKQFRNLLNKKTQISVAIKGNAYGHGQNEIAKILEPYVDYFQVNNVEELRLLRKISKKKTLILGYIQKSNLFNVLKLKNTILTVFSITQLIEINKTAKRLGKIQEICISVDAYLGREGFLLNELKKILREIKKCRYIKIHSAYAHFANIEDTHPSERSLKWVTNFTHAHKQIKAYKKAIELFELYGFRVPKTHISATSGILVYEKGTGAHDIVRLGIGIYGMWPSEHLKFLYKNSKFKLKPVLSWKTKVAQIKTLPKGFPVGYGLTYIAKKETRIAVIPQGYADGFDRGLSNKGEVLIKETRCKVIGRVSMNMFTVDVSHLRNIKIEDEVVIIGKQGKEEITVEEIAKKLDTINYEITTRISPLLPRIVV